MHLNAERNAKATIVTAGQNMQLQMARLPICTVDKRQLVVVFLRRSRHALWRMCGAPDEARPVFSACMGEPHASIQLLLCTGQVPIVDVHLHLQSGQVQLRALHLHATKQLL